MSKTSGKMVVNERDLFFSKAWLSLGGIAPQVLSLFWLRRRMEKVGKRGGGRWVNTNARELIFPYREAKEKFGITQPRFTRAIDDLIDKGFIDIVTPGNGTAKEVTVYGLSERWRQYGTPAFEAKPREHLKVGFCQSRRKGDKNIAYENAC